MAQRYTLVAPLYDVVSLEWPVYRSGRVIGIPLLGLSEGDTVLDVGCGTGLNFPLLLEAVGSRGHIVGVDRSSQMLDTARRRLPRTAAHRVDLVCADATSMSTQAGVRDRLGEGPDAILFTYSLSLMHPWQQTWTAATSLARRGTRIVVVDMRLPTGRAAWLGPLARLACRAGGADITAHPWTALAQECVDVTHRAARGGHIQVWAGTWPERPDHPR